MMELTAEQVRAAISYDPETGLVVWRAKMGQRGKIGAVAGGPNSLGYQVIQLFGVKYQAQRLIWLYVHGHWPTHHIDHINGCPGDNRLVNLRDVGYEGNNQNRRAAHRQNKSGYLGVSQFGAKWRAEIQANKVRHHLGLFDTAQAAHDAYLTAKRQLHSTCSI